MSNKLCVLGLTLTLSVLIISGCATPTAEPVGPSTGEGEYCVDKATGTKMSYEEAVEIAEGSECVAQGGLKEARFCNEDTGTWWIDLDIEKPGCMPACVVKVSDKMAEINWRCTGAVPPEDTAAVLGPARARDAALDYIFDRYGEVVFPPPGSDWTEENVTGEGLVGASTFRYTAADLVVTVSFPVVNPADTIYQVAVSKESTGFRWEGEVDAAGQVTEISASDAQLPVVAWYGYVASTPTGAQFDDCLVLMPKGVGEIGVEGADETVEAQIVALRDRPEPGKYANFWGNLTCDVLDYGGCQLLVTRLRVDGPGPFFEPDLVEGWEGTLVSGPPGPRSGGDDYFVLAGDFPVQYGVDSLDPAIAAQLESLRDTGAVIRVWGELSAGVIDWNAAQIQVERLEIAVEAPAAAQLPVVAWYGYVASTPEGAQFDDYLVLMPKEARRAVGIEGAGEAVEAEIVALRDKEEPGKYAHFWGTLNCDLPDYGGCQLLVTRLRVDGPGPFFDPDPVDGWQGTIVSGPAGPRSGGDDYLVVLVGGIPIEYGIDCIDTTLAAQIESLRDTGTIVRVWGQVSAGVIDWNGTQIQVDRLEIAVEAPAAPVGYEGWKPHLNAEFGYALWYPGDCQVMGANLNESVQFSGPLVEGDHWPVLTVSHYDSDFYHPPAGTNVDQWIADQEMPYDEIDTEVEIAGLPAVHLRYEAGPGWYASDAYHFIKDGQLFHILILHTGGQEGWELYDRFLQGLTFLDM